METEEISPTSIPDRYCGRIAKWAAARRAHLLIAAAMVLFIWIPFYGNLWPSLVDLPEHLLVSKLLWETLAGTSSLDLQLSWFLGYKLFPYFSLLFIGLLKSLGISLVYLPQLMSCVLIGMFAAIVGAIGIAELEDRRLGSLGIAACFILPAAVCMYVACWFIGFVNYTLAITFLIAGIYFGDRFLSEFKLRPAVYTFVFLALAYLSHPFVPAFWLIWCFGRGLASIVLWRLPKEWRRLIFLGAIFAPVALYHVAATAGSPLAPKTDIMWNESPFTPFAEWMKNRFWPMFDGMYFKADDIADGSLFALFALVFVLSAVFVAFWFRKDDSSRALILAAVFATVTASLINEKFIPVPAGHWLAYDYRFVSTTYAICIVTAMIVIIRHLPDLLENAKFRAATGIFAAIAAIASLGHLFGVRAAYSRFDTAARPYMDKVLNGEQPTGMSLPHSRWHPDGTLIKLYICMVQIDCNPVGTTFIHGYSGDLYPVKYGSKRPQDTVTKPGLSSPAATSGTLQKPRGVAAGDGRYYVADTGNARIQVFDAAGNFKSSFGEGKLREPNGVAVTEGGSILITDAGAGKLLKFDQGGNFLTEWAGPSPGLYGPRDIAAGPGQTFYIVDQGRSRIVRFDSKAETFTEWGTQGDQPGQFREATGIAVANGSVFVADNGNNRIQVFDLNGVFIRQWEVPEWDRYIWQYPDLVYDNARKLLYVTSGTTRQVLAFDLTGNRSEAIEVSGLDNPSSLAISGTGNKRELIVINTGNSTVVRVPLAASTQARPAR
jgi:DNA-binding beta-propeller fold protein YncE